MKVRLSLVFILILSMGTGATGCKGATAKGSPSSPQLHVFAMKVEGQQTNTWTYRGNPCDSTYVDAGSETSLLAKLDGGIVAVYYDPTVPGPIHGTSTVHLDIERFASSQETGNGHACHPSGCAPDCGVAEDGCGVKNVDSNVTFTYDGSRLEISTAIPEAGQAGCGLGAVAPTDREHYSDATFSSGPLPSADLVDKSKISLSTPISGSRSIRQIHGGEEFIQDIDLGLSVELRRVASVVAGKTITAANCEAALAVLKGWQDAGQPAGQTQWSIAFEAGPTTHHTLADGGSKTSTTLTPHPLEHIISLPVWTNIPHDPTTEGAWKNALKLLLAHEEGHVQITKDFVSNHPSMPVSGTGTDERNALKDLQRNVADAIDAGAEQLSVIHHEYDIKTEHGLKQVNDGGRNAVLVCPPR